MLMEESYHDWLAWVVLVEYTQQQVHTFLSLASFCPAFHNDCYSVHLFNPCGSCSSYSLCASFFLLFCVTLGHHLTCLLQGPSDLCVNLLQIKMYFEQSAHTITSVWRVPKCSNHHSYRRHMCAQVLCMNSYILHILVFGIGHNRWISHGSVQ